MLETLGVPDSLGKELLQAHLVSLVVHTRIHELVLKVGVCQASRQILRQCHQVLPAEVNLVVVLGADVVNFLLFRALTGIAGRRKQIFTHLDCALGLTLVHGSETFVAAFHGRLVHLLGRLVGSRWGGVTVDLSTGRFDSSARTIGFFAGMRFPSTGSCSALGAMDNRVLTMGTPAGRVAATEVRVTDGARNTVLVHIKDFLVLVPVDSAPREGVGPVLVSPAAHETGFLEGALDGLNFVANILNLPLLLSLEHLGLDLQNTLDLVLTLHLKPELVLTLALDLVVVLLLGRSDREDHRLRGGRLVHLRRGRSRLGKGRLGPHLLDDGEGGGVLVGVLVVLANRD